MKIFELSLTRTTCAKINDRSLSPPALVTQCPLHSVTTTYPLWLTAILCMSPHPTNSQEIGVLSLSTGDLTVTGKGLPLMCWLSMDVGQVPPLDGRLIADLSPLLCTLPCTLVFAIQSILINIFLPTDPRPTLSLSQDYS